MLETLSTRSSKYLTLLFSHMAKSEKALSAGNQQERLISIGWITGFVDGEGCFSIGFIRQAGGGKRKGYKTGYQVSHEFAVTQGEKNLESLHMVKEFFGVGNVYVNKRYDNHKEHLYRYVVRRRNDLREIIVPFFRENKLRTTKQQDFEKFAKCIELINDGDHLSRDGLVKIAEITETMNHKKPRRELIRILRD
jgi:hypothetical protein